MCLKILVRIKKSVILETVQVSEKCFDDSNKLVVSKMKHETADVAIKEFVGLKLMMYPFLVDNSSEHKKTKEYANSL